MKHKTCHGPFLFHFIKPSGYFSISHYICPMSLFCLNYFALILFDITVYFPISIVLFWKGHLTYEIHGNEYIRYSFCSLYDES